MSSTPHSFIIHNNLLLALIHVASYSLLQLGYTSLLWSVNETKHEAFARSSWGYASRYHSGEVPTQGLNTQVEFEATMLLKQYGNVPSIFRCMNELLQCQNKSLWIESREDLLTRLLETRYTTTKSGKESQTALRAQVKLGIRHPSQILMDSCPGTIDFCCSSGSATW